MIYNTPMFRVCQTNPRGIQCSRGKQQRLATCVKLRARKHTNNEGLQVDGNLIGLGVSVCSALVVLSACTVTALTLREAEFETQHMLEDYAKLESKVMMLEDKDVQHELVINALVNEILKLRDIGIV